MKAEAEISTIAIGMIRDPEYAEEIVDTGNANLVAIARGFLIEPGWVHRAAKELDSEVLYPNQYLRAMSQNWSRAFPERVDEEVVVETHR